MRAPSLLGSAPSLSRTIWTAIVGSAVAAALAAPKAVEQPVLDFSRMGRVLFAGDFSGVSAYQYQGQNRSEFSDSNQSLYTQLPNGLFTSLATADDAINTMCVYEGGGQKGIVVGGDFTSLGGVKAKGIALYNPDDGKITAMEPFDGKVNALLCDKDTNSVYVGGMFTYERSENAIVWRDGKWNQLPFEGFSGEVHTIARSNNNSILFGGNFEALKNFTAPAVKHAQVINLASPRITAEQTSDSAGFDDPKSITCTNDTSKQWLLRDGQKGSWTANFDFEFRPTKLRLINANFGGRGTKVFRLTTPLNGIMNLTYTENGQKKYCDAWCPLAQSDAPQDFEFQDVIGMKAIRLEIWESWGPGGGLSSVQLFQDDIYSYAISDLNEPSCAPAATRSNSTKSGNWEAKPNVYTDAFLSADIDEAQRSDTQVSFVPHVQQKGTYQIYVYTPGCTYDGTCGQRGKVRITGSVTKDGRGEKIDQVFFQTNEFDKYDMVYSGPVDPPEGDFKPTITLAPTPDQSMETVTIVAQKVEFRLRGNDTQSDDSGSGRPGNATARLNGIYEYNPKDKKTPNPAESKLSSVGLKLRDNATIRSIVVRGDNTYFLGNFIERNDTFRHFFSVSKDGNVRGIGNGGLDEAIQAAYVVGDKVYVGGSFQKTKEGKALPSVAVYDLTKDEWGNLRGGLSGTVTEITSVMLNVTGSIKEGIAFSGEVAQIKPETGDGNPVPVEKMAVWIPSEKKWLKSELQLTGILSASIKSGDDTIYAGSVAANSLSSGGAVYVYHDGAAASSLNLQSSTMVFSATSGSNRKRAVADVGVSGVATALFYVDDDKARNLTILGGHFSAQNRRINHLAIVNGGSGDISGAFNQFTAQSTILTLHRVNTELWVGGALEGEQDISGVAIWDFDRNSLADKQPPGLDEGDANNVTVHSITSRPDMDDVYVAGEFSSAGSLDCPNLCVYTNKQWVQASSDTPGSIYYSRWVDKDTLLIAGNMMLNNTATYIATYDATQRRFRSLDADTSKIPGPITSVGVDSGNSDSMFVSGKTKDGNKPFIMKLRNGEFVTVDHKFSDKSEIKQVQVLYTTENHDESDVVKDNTMLVVSGRLEIQGYGDASVATFNGKEWLPLLLTSTQSGGAGTVAGLFSQTEEIFEDGAKKMAKGYVILISLAIALALVFLLVCAGVLASYIRRRREGYVPAPTSMGGAEKSTAMTDRLPPQDLLAQRDPAGTRAPVI